MQMLLSKRTPATCPSDQGSQMFLSVQGTKSREAGLPPGKVLARSHNQSLGTAPTVQVTDGEPGSGNNFPSHSLQYLLCCTRN